MIETTGKTQKKRYSDDKYAYTVKIEDPATPQPTIHVWVRRSSDSSGLSRYMPSFLGGGKRHYYRYHTGVSESIDESVEKGMRRARNKFEAEESADTVMERVDP